MLRSSPSPDARRPAHFALRPRAAACYGDAYYARGLGGVSDADSVPTEVYRWIAARVLAGEGSLAYQGVTLSLANFDQLDLRARVCAIQQSSIFIRVSIARLINEPHRLRMFTAFAARAPRLGRLLRPAFDFCFRRSQICLGHNQFVRRTCCSRWAAFQPRRHDSTSAMIGARGVLMGRCRCSAWTCRRHRDEIARTRGFTAASDDVACCVGVAGRPPNASTRAARPAVATR